MMMNLVVILDLVLVMEVVGFYKNKTSFNIYKLNIITCMGRRCRSLVLQCYNCRIRAYPMSEEQLKAFLEKVQGDTSLQEQLKAEGADVIAIAKAAGFTITTDDLEQLKNQKALSEGTITDLSDEELESMAGGFFSTARLLGFGDCPVQANTWNCESTMNTDNLTQFY